MPRIDSKAPAKTWNYAMTWNDRHGDKEYQAGWAKITLGSDGSFNVISDWYNLSFGWWAHGYGENAKDPDGENGKKDFRHFWLGMHNEINYFLSKFGQFNDNQIQIPETVARIREELLTWRREGAIDKDGDELKEFVRNKHRHLFNFGYEGPRKRRRGGDRHPWYRWGMLSEYDDLHGYREEADLLKELENEEIDEREYRERSHISEVYEYFVTDYPVRARNFARGFLAEFANIIADELEAEGHDVSRYRQKRAEYDARPESEKY